MGIEDGQTRCGYAAVRASTAERLERRGLWDDGSDALEVGTAYGVGSQAGVRGVDGTGGPTRTSKKSMKLGQECRGKALAEAFSDSYFGDR